MRMIPTMEIELSGALIIAQGSIILIEASGDLL
jgi:hypothetical protein